jgi:tetratricopeptide (TPR) repeat protein
MRGLSNKGLFDKYARAVAGFPPTARDKKSARDVFAESYQALSELADPDQGGGFPRALAWKGYALALSVYEGWPLPKGVAEKSMRPKKRLDRAKELVAEAIRLDPDDYDVHWAMADVHLFRKEFKAAREEFEIAIDLNRDERHPSLFAEAASAMMQIGDFDAAQMYFRKASQQPDWHHWMKGIMLYLKAGRAGPEHEETFLNLALEELNCTGMQLEDDFYQTEIQLVHAATHWRKWKLLTTKANKLPEGALKSRTQVNAERNRVSARRAIRAFRAKFPYWKLDQALAALVLQVKSDRKYWQDAVTALWALSRGK